MRKFQHLLLALCIITVVACKKDKKTEDTNTDTTTENVESTSSNSETSTTSTSTTESDGITKVTIALEAKSGSSVSGNAVIREQNGVVSLMAVFDGLSEGTHAIHIHEKADCSSDDGTSTGGHWNPTGQPHGQWGDEKGYHKGDIGNFTADANGHGYISFNTQEWCIGCGDPAKDILGKALIVHQGADDFTSQPSGAAGSRVSCGGIIKE